MFRFERGLLGLPAVAILACLFVASAGLAQTGTTSLRGTILDNSGAVIAGAGIVAGALTGLALMRFAAGIFGVIRMPGTMAIAGAATLLLMAAVLASLLPAARASRVDALQALRSD